MISIVFPGQGSQKIGMGLDFYNKFELVKEIFKKANDILGYKISDLIFDGSQDKFTRDFISAWNKVMNSDRFEAL